MWSFYVLSFIHENEIALVTSFGLWFELDPGLKSWYLHLAVGGRRQDHPCQAAQFDDSRLPTPWARIDAVRQVSDIFFSPKLAGERTIDHPTPASRWSSLVKMTEPVLGSSTTAARATLLTTRKIPGNSAQKIAAICAARLAKVSGSCHVRMIVYPRTVVVASRHPQFLGTGTRPVVRRRTGANGNIR